MDDRIVSEGLGRRRSDLLLVSREYTPEIIQI